LSKSIIKFTLFAFFINILPVAFVFYSGVMIKNDPIAHAIFYKLQIPASILLFFLSPFIGILYFKDSRKIIIKNILKFYILTIFIISCVIEISIRTNDLEDITGLSFISFTKVIFYSMSFYVMLSIIPIIIILIRQTLLLINSRN
jgi:hypothetical protein